jgi:formate hydrogenlyase subunit 6/NADH:ubiquinone oxidoreductase subunit I
MTTEKKRPKPMFIRKKCTACISCSDTCPVGCIEMVRDEKGDDPHAYPCLAREEVCIGCGDCAEECPVDAIEMVA